MLTYAKIALMTKRSRQAGRRSNYSQRTHLLREDPFGSWQRGLDLGKKTPNAGKGIDNSHPQDGTDGFGLMPREKR
jgi:hypothetical protein